MRILAFAYVAMGLLLVGCAAGAHHDDLHAPTVASLDPSCLTAPSFDTNTGSPNYQIQAGDKLKISFYLNPEFDSEIVIRPDGKFSMPVIGELRAAGSTPSQLAELLNRKYSDELRNPSAVVLVEDSPSRVVYVTGEVERAGAIPLQRGMTALQAIAQAGGMKETAGVQKVLLIRRAGCGEPQSTILDLERVIKRTSNAEDALLMPTDVLFVPMSGVARTNLFVKQYIRNMLPVNPYIPIP